MKFLKTALKIWERPKYPIVLGFIIRWPYTDKAEGKMFLVGFWGTILSDYSCGHVLKLV